MTTTLPALSGTQRMFDALPATLADADARAEKAEYDGDFNLVTPMLEDFLTRRQVDRLVTEEYCFICSRSTDHRGEDHIATQASVSRFAASALI